MAVRKQKPSRIRKPSRRTQIVWVSFIGAMALVAGILALGERDRPGGFLAANLASIGQVGSTADPVFEIDAVLDRSRWTGIVVHHLGAPAGDAQTIHRQHQAFGYQGLGYHFLIGNGNGLGDGVVHVGYRWNRQLPGAHTVGADSDYHNRHSIGICLIGNGDRRPFTERQTRSLLELVRRLQNELDVPAERVHLHRDVAPEVRSPGRHFPTARFASGLE